MSTETPPVPGGAAGRSRAPIGDETEVETPETEPTETPEDDNGDEGAA